MVGHQMLNSEVSERAQGYRKDVADLQKFLNLFLRRWIIERTWHSLVDVAVTYTKKPITLSKLATRASTSAESNTCHKYHKRCNMNSASKTHRNVRSENGRLECQQLAL
jgi:hypothetical protein